MTQPANPIRVRIGTRGSPLALVQAEQTAKALTEASEDALVCEIVTFTTSGDQLTTERLINAGGKGLFTKEIDLAVDTGQVDIAVHSLKDVPSVLPPGQSLVAFPKREDPREGFLSPHGASLEALPQGAVLGTASLRREAQSLHQRPDLKPVPFRGNVQTRLRKLDTGEADATFLAMAGLTRLGVAHLAHPLPIDVMLPAPCQGIIAVAAIEERLPPALKAALAAYDHAPTRRAAMIERAFLAALDGSCRTPIAGHAALVEADRFVFRGEVLSPDGQDRWAAEASVMASTESDLEAVGRAVAEDIRAAAGGSLPQFADL